MSGAGGREAQTQVKITQVELLMLKTFAEKDTMLLLIKTEKWVLLDIHHLSLKPLLIPS